MKIEGIALVDFYRKLEEIPDEESSAVENTPKNNE